MAEGSSPMILSNSYREVGHSSAYHYKYWPWGVIYWAITATGIL